MAPAQEASVNVASESASKKRKINETDSPADVPKAPEEARQRFQDLWHEDGSVVIQTKDAEFCVHRTVVSLHSPVLRAKLDALFASTRRDVYDGSAQSVVTLQVEDRGYDLSAILSIMYQGGKSIFLGRSQPTILFEDLRLAVILGIKYQVDYVKEEAIDRLSKLFPSRSMDDWDTHLRQEDINPPIRLTGIDAIATVGLARLLDAPYLLPMAFYVCANQGANTITGVKYGDDHARLSEADQLTCLAMRDEMLEAKNKVFRVLLEYTAGASLQGCKTPEACHDAVDKLNLEVAKSGCTLEPSAVDPMDSWLDRTYLADPSRKPCAVCDKHIRSTMDRRRRVAWKKLGDLVGVKPWPSVPAT